MHILTTEKYRKREKTIGLPIIIEYDFFRHSDIQRKRFLASSVISKVEGLKEMIERNKLDTNLKQLILDLNEELGHYM